MADTDEVAVLQAVEARALQQLPEPLAKRVVYCGGEYPNLVA